MFFLKRKCKHKNSLVIEYKKYHREYDVPNAKTVAVKAKCMDCGEIFEL